MAAICEQLPLPTHQVNGATTSSMKHLQSGMLTYVGCKLVDTMIGGAPARNQLTRVLTASRRLQRGNPSRHNARRLRL